MRRWLLTWVLPEASEVESRKMAARLQAAQGGGAPVLLRTSSDAGHGARTPVDERIAHRADQYAFLLHHIGAPAK